ncbi:MAG: hypothetical protein DRI90_14605 [Deltaproteobacteria bacterium]|nr:MAG: hypothetical protein DRI90_14605 [Deltaproteobacteria bacterium]
MLTAMRRLLLLALLVLPSGCGGEETEPAAPQLPPTCEEHELLLPDGSCIRPGVPPDGCGEGFVHDGTYGCEPILPAEPCPPGLMAVPGDESCRSVMECGEGKWGDLPVDATTQYVDGSYGGGDGDGSEAQPWPTIGQAVAAAAPGALIAVGAGTYNENVLIDGKPVRLWGRCPEQVAIAAPAEAVGPCPPTALCILGGADGTEVGGLALRGAGVGILLAGSEHVLADRIRVHDNAGRGITAESTFHSTSIEVRGSLIEHNHDFGLFVMGADAIVDASVVRATLPRASDQRGGRGISIQLPCSSTSTGLQCDATARGNASVTRSLIEQNHEAGLLVFGSNVIVDGTVVRATLPSVSDQRGGRGINIQPSCLPTPTGLECDSAARGSASVSRSLIEQNYDVGLLVTGSDANVDATVVRTTLPRASDQLHGRGINVQSLCVHTPTGLQCDAAARASANVTRSLIEHNHEFGLLVASSDANVDATVVRATLSNASYNLFGDGLSVLNKTAPGSATLTNLLIADSARAGLATFGSFVSLADTHIRCAAFPLNGEPFEGSDFELDDRGGNSCGCPTADDTCKLISAGLQPPDPLATNE